MGPKPKAKTKSKQKSISSDVLSARAQRKDIAEDILTTPSPDLASLPLLEPMEEEHCRASPAAILDGPPVNDENVSKTPDDLITCSTAKRGRGRPAKATALKKLLEESRYIIEMGDKNGATSLPLGDLSTLKEGGRSRRRAALETMERIAKAAKGEDKVDDDLAIDSDQLSGDLDRLVKPKKARLELDKTAIKAKTSGDKSRTSAKDLEIESDRILQPPSPLANADSNSLTQPATFEEDSLAVVRLADVEATKEDKKPIDTRAVSPELDDLFVDDHLPSEEAKTAAFEREAPKKPSRKRGHHKKLKVADVKSKDRRKRTKKEAISQDSHGKESACTVLRREDMTLEELEEAEKRGGEGSLEDPGERGNDIGSARSEGSRHRRHRHRDHRRKDSGKHKSWSEVAEARAAELEEEGE